MAGRMFSVTVTGDSREKLDLMREILMPARLAQFLSEEGHEVILSRIGSRFTNEGDDASGPWAALKYPTQVARREMGLGDQHPINIRTGQLKLWLFTDQPDVVMAGGGASYTFPGGTPVDPKTAEKFATAQGGATKPPTVPRPVVAIGTADALLMTEALGVWFNARMSGAIIP